jgi:hypothetical protein
MTKNNIFNFFKVHAPLLIGLFAQLLFLLMHYKWNWFKTDDFLNFAIAQDMGLTKEFLLRGIFGHFSPGHRFIDYLAIEFFSFSWSAAFSLLSFFAVITTINVYNLALYITSRRELLLLVIFISAISPIYISSLSWFAAGLHSITALAFWTAALLFAVRYHLSLKFSDLIGYILSFSLALCFYSKAIFIPASAFFFVLAVESIRHNVVFRHLLKRNLLILSFGIFILMVYAFILMTGDYKPGRIPVSPQRWIEWGSHFVLSGPLSAFFGIARVDSIFDSILSPIYFVIFLLMIIYSYISKNLFALCFLIFSAILGIILTGYGRAGEFGPSVAGEYRYSTELAPFGALFMVFIFRRLPKKYIKVVYLASILYGISALITTHNLLQSKYDPNVRLYFENLSKSVSRHEIVNFYDTSVPFYILNPIFDPYSRTSRALRLLSISPSISNPLDMQGMLLNKFGDYVFGRRMDLIDIESEACIMVDDLMVLTSKADILNMTHRNPIYVYYEIAGHSVEAELLPGGRKIVFDNKNEPTLIDLGTIKFQSVNVTMKNSCLKQLRIFTHADLE